MLALRRIAVASRVARPTLVQRLARPACVRTLCAPPKPTGDGATAASGSKANGEQLPGAAEMQPDLATTSSTPPDTPPPQEEAQASESKNLTLQDHDGENLPPLQFEPGIAGTAQKGVSAIVIAFGAAAFGACAYGISLALFPSASSTQSIYTEAFELVQRDPNVSYALGSPLRAHGIDHGTARGRRNAMERWEVNEGGEDLTIIRFAVAGPQGAGVIQVQVPAKRRRGEFRYVIFENRRNRQLFHVLDERASLVADNQPPPPPASVPAPAAASAATG